VIAINQDAATANVTGQALREHLSVLMGSGGNIGVLDGPDGLLLVDAGIAVSRPKIVAALSSISTKNSCKNNFCVSGVIETYKIAAFVRDE
jgi:hypothetical protein